MLHRLGRLLLLCPINSELVVQYHGIETGLMMVACVSLRLRMQNKLQHRDPSAAKSPTDPEASHPPHIVDLHQITVVNRAPQ